MKVQELIEFLKTMPPDSEVLCYKDHDVSMVSAHGPKTLREVSEKGWGTFWINDDVEYDEVHRTIPNAVIIRVDGYL